MNNYAKLDESEAPVIKITFNKEEPSEEIFDDYLKKLHKIISQDQRIILLFDASQATFLSSKLRIKQGKFLKEYQSLIAKNVVSYVFIIPSKIIQIVFQGILMVSPLPAPYQVVKDMTEAQKVIQKLIKEYNLQSSIS